MDWLHGSAESMLTITNLLIVFGLKEARSAFSATNANLSSLRRGLEDGAPYVDEKIAADTTAETGDLKLLDAGLPILGLTFALTSGLFQAHPEPWNALSIPTWMVHVSSLLEWLVAMQLIWDHSLVSGNPRWKGLTIGMIPSHTSGLCACTYHLFYNSSELNWLVTLQALLTLLGNTTMACGAYRIWKWEQEQGWYSLRGTEKEISSEIKRRNIPRDKTEMSLFLENTKLGEDNASMFAAKILGVSVTLSLVVKYGELYLDFPFDESHLSTYAVSCVVIPTLLNILKWVIRSRDPSSKFGTIF